MKRFLIHVSTYWCGMDNTFRAEAESELDPDEMEDSYWDKFGETVDASQYYNFTIEEFEGDDEEWEEYGGEIYGKDN